jgi:hypothetical protein
LAAKAFASRSKSTQLLSNSPEAFVNSDTANRTAESMLIQFTEMIDRASLLFLEKVCGAMKTL